MKNITIVYFKMKCISQLRHFYSLVYIYSNSSWVRTPPPHIGHNLKYSDFQVTYRKHFSHKAASNCRCLIMSFLYWWHQLYNIARDKQSNHVKYNFKRGRFSLRKTEIRLQLKNLDRKVAYRNISSCCTNLDNPLKLG